MRSALHSFQRWGKILQRWMITIPVIILGLHLWVGPALATSVSDVPNISTVPNQWVADEGDVLSPISERSLNQSLGRVAKQTDYRVNVVTIRRLDYGETPQSFTDELFQQWFPDPELQTNQVILFLDTKTNDSAIKTGAQVKTVLSDDVAESIASESLLVPIREGKYNEGLLEASNRLVAVLSGQPDPGAPKVEAETAVERTYLTSEETNDTSASVIVVVAVIIATVVPMVTYYWYQNQG